MAERWEGSSGRHMDPITTEDMLYDLLLLSIVMPWVLFAITFERGVMLLRRWGMVQKNYVGQLIPTAGGLILFANLTVTWSILTGLMVHGRIYDGYLKAAVLFLAGSFAILLFGWQDDGASDKKSKGFRGHFRTLWYEQRMTSGLLKALGGAGTALIISIPLSHGFGETMLNMILLSLSTNLINLFDVRPTRAIKVFWAISILVFMASPLVGSSVAWIWFLPVLSATLCFFFRDGQGVIMLGDTGSNYLGYIMGFEMLVALSPMVKLAVVCLFLLLHILAEKFSFSRAIQSKALLNWLDSLGRHS